MKLKNLILALIVAVFATGAIFMPSNVLAATYRLGSDTPVNFNPTRKVIKTAAYTVGANDSQVNVTTSGADIVITLPSIATTRSAGNVSAFKILKTDSTAFKVVVTPATGDTIGGESTRYLVNQNNFMVISLGPGRDWSVDFESPYTVEDHEAGTLQFTGLNSTELASSTTIVGTNPSLTIGDAGAEDTKLVYDGAAQDFYVGLDDTDDDLKIGLGSAVGTTPALAIDETLVTTWVGGTVRLAATTAATDTLTAAECGKDIYLSHATEFATTLPAMSTVAAGCEFNFVIAAAASGADYTVLTGNSLENLIFGNINVNSAIVACADEDTITFVDGNAIGDTVKLKSDGTSWFITGEGFTAAKLTCTQAD